MVCRTHVAASNSERNFRTQSIEANFFQVDIKSFKQIPCQMRDDRMRTGSGKRGKDRSKDRFGSGRRLSFSAQRLLLPPATFQRVPPGT